ncbi:type II secretion system inner membrane protein GspF [Candidatus Manganitrophus noduliformans]|uniref:General secretion pathway protein F n=1 Tax=Candidatus Manganitrophus noduliformans TaxID=2606439 RepID=A0A7X6DQF6_9BACT|nr:type II secretion system inner membrane protein GspF [Candidatus Manganitrophus noduliformans]NKE71399.1 type II secretion system protein GspF [Candidatus Manganitrophus noduliformans]
MAIYEYKGLDVEGKSKAGIVDADSPKVARAKLRKSGIFPVEITQTQQAAPTGLSKPVTLFSEGMTLAETAVMTRQLSTLLGAGISLMEALGALTEQVEKPAAKKIWIDVREGVKEGASLADALTRHPKVFSVLYRQMVRAGEASGTLDRILVRLADYLESQVRLRNKLFSILTYPVLMLFVSGAILIFLISFVVPKVTAIFADLNQALPLPTVILLALSDFLRGYGWLLIGAGVLGGMIYRRHIQTPRGREQYDRLLLRIPLAGRVAKMVAISRFTRTLATLLASGVPLLTALEIVQQVVGNKVLEEAIQGARGNIREGQSIAEPLKRSGLFPPLVTHMIAIGEKSGELEGMLQKVSEAYDNEVETVVTGMTSLLAPLMILGMGGVVLFIVLAILLPIFEVSQIVK